MDWFILGIEPTKDKKAITAAYRQKLRQTNPEDKPEEFKALRSAYEQALAYAEQEETEPVRDDSPVGRWMESVERLYEDFASRINPGCWKALMEADVCMGLDTRSAAEEALMQFLLEHYFLPQSVWQVLDAVFSFTERMEELAEIWPQGFIDHVLLPGIRMEPALSYDLYCPGQNAGDCDAYRRLYFQAVQGPQEEIPAVLVQMDDLSERHPMGELLRFRFYMESGREQEGRAGLQTLAEAYPDVPSIALTWASQCLSEGRAEEAKSICLHLLDLNPAHLGAKVICADALAAMCEYNEAKEYAYEILHLSSSDPILMEQIHTKLKEWNLHLIEDQEARFSSHPEDTDNAIDLAWCYFQNEREADAFAVAEKIDPARADPFDYHNLMGKLHHNAKRFTQALEHLQTVEEILRKMTPDGTRETEKRLARLPEMLQAQGNCLMQLGRTEEARNKLEQALEEAPGDPEVLAMMGKILFSVGDYDYAVEIQQRLLQAAPGTWFAELLLAMCLYRLHRDREAYDAVNRALAIQGNDLSLYILKMQLLMRNGVYEEVRETLEFLRESNAPEDLSTEFIRAELIELEQKQADQALKQYRSIRQQVEAGQDMLLCPELYYHLAVLTGNQMNLTQEANRNTVLQLIDRGLGYHQQDSDLLAYKAWVLKKGGLLEEAIVMYRELAQKNPNSLTVLRGLADLYYEDLPSHAAEALELYEKLLERQKSAELYFFAATCKRQLGDVDGARIYYLKELEMDPEDIDAFRGLTFLCDGQGDYEKSLFYLDRGLAVMEEYDRRYDWLVEHKAKVLRRMGRAEEALAFVQEAATRYHYANALQLQFDICCQFGLWDRAKQLLSLWKQENRTDPDQMAATARLHLLMGKPFKAAVAMAPAKHKLPFEQIQDFRLQLNDLECNHQRQIQIWSRRVRENPSDDHAMTSLAHAYWHMGQKEAAFGAARKALALLDGILAQNRTDEALYRSRRCLVLAILGRTEEAVAELAVTRKLPLCDYCEYGSCKDADIYEAAIAEILGNREEAQKLYQAGKAKWPDDLDFAAGELRLKKKGRR